MSITYKLPAEFVAKHRAVLDAWPWRSQPQMPLSEALPDIPELAPVVLEIASRGGLTIVRSKNGKSMVTLRIYADNAGVV